MRLFPGYSSRRAGGISAPCAALSYGPHEPMLVEEARGARATVARLPGYPEG